MKLDPKFIEDQKQRLLAAKQEIEQEIEDLKGVPDMGSDTDSFEEEADEAEEYVAHLSMSDALAKDLQSINEALSEIAKGVYGICGKCGKKMTRALLLVAPESRICRECKLKQLPRKQ
jgi:DnaK suppressor protein